MAPNWRIQFSRGSVVRFTVSSDVAAGENSNAVLAAVQAELADFAVVDAAGWRGMARPGLDAADPDAAVPLLHLRAQHVQRGGGG